MSKNSLLTFRFANTADYTRFAALISHVEGRTITGDTLHSWDAHKQEDGVCPSAGNVLACKTAVKWDKNESLAPSA